MDHGLAIIGVGMAIIGCYLLRRWNTPKRLQPAGRSSVFISGCDSGIGHHLATYLGNAGCRIYAGCLDPAVACQTLPDSVIGVQLDVTNGDSVSRAVETVKTSLAENGAHLDVLVNNAGVCVYGEFDWLTWEQCERQVQVNLLGTMRLIKAFLPMLRRKKRETANSRIITITSVNGSIAYPGLAVYSATKFALEGFHDALRIELKGIVKVIVVQPGDLARLTCIMSRHVDNARDMWDNMSQDDRDHYNGYFQHYHDIVLKNYGLTSPSRFEDSPLLSDVHHACFDPKSKDRYMSASLTSRFVYCLLIVMPKSMSGWIIGWIADRILKSGGDSQQ